MRQRFEKENISGKKRNFDSPAERKPVKQARIKSKEENMNKKIAILGGGPIGIEMAIAAVRKGYHVTLIEKAIKIAGNMRAWQHVHLFSPNKNNFSKEGRTVLQECRVVVPKLEIFPTGTQYIKEYLDPLVSYLQKLGSSRFVLRCNTEVLSVGRGGISKKESGGEIRRKTMFRILVCSNNNTEEIIEDIDIVVDATGTYGNHNWIGKGGIPAIGERNLASHNMINYVIPDIVNEAVFKTPKTTTVVIGSGASAITSLNNLKALGKKCKNQDEEVNVIWITKRNEMPYKLISKDPLPLRDSLYRLGNLLATEDPSAVDGYTTFSYKGLLDVIKIELVEENEKEKEGPFRYFKMSLQNRETNETEIIKVHNILAHVGYRPDTKITEELRVHYCYASMGPMKLAAAMLASSGGGGGDCLAQVCPGPQTMLNPESLFFIIGMKSYGRGSSFLLQLGHEQIQNVMTLITKSCPLSKSVSIATVTMTTTTTATVGTET